MKLIYIVLLNLALCSCALNDRNELAGLLWKKSIVQGTEGRIAVVEAGGQNVQVPMVFLHADPGNATQWQSTMVQFATVRRVIAFDARGHGDSQLASNSDYSYQGRAQDLADVADAMHLDSFIVVAHSGAGAVALRYAADHPDKVRGMVLVDPPTNPTLVPDAIRSQWAAPLNGPNGRHYLRQYLGLIAGHNKEVLDRILKDSEEIPIQVYISMTKALASWNPQADLSRFRRPMLILSSEANDVSASLSRLKPDADYRVIHSSGHWLQLDQPRSTVDMIKNFADLIDTLH